MTPKIDPYATPRGRAVDLFLVLFALATIVLAIATAPGQGPKPDPIVKVPPQTGAAGQVSYSPLAGRDRIDSTTNNPWSQR